MELVAEHGFDGMVATCRVLLSEAMKIERADILQTRLYERTGHGRTYTNGFRPKTVQTRLDTIILDIPQTRGVAF